MNKTESAVMIVIY